MWKIRVDEGEIFGAICQVERWSKGNQSLSGGCSSKLEALPELRRRGDEATWATDNPSLSCRPALILSMPICLTEKEVALLGCLCVESIQTSGASLSNSLPISGVQVEVEVVQFEIWTKLQSNYSIIDSDDRQNSLS